MLIWVQVWIHLGSLCLPGGLIRFSLCTVFVSSNFFPLWRPLYFDININYLIFFC